ncbi:ISAs1 family transposase [Deinococcus sp.]|uniref:ISAs1 family transposase n=1 Tax=Deinococcus sp. TaxID=47478 RepID=UPI003B59B15D
MKPKPISPLPFLTQIPDWRDQNRITYEWNALWTLMLVGLLTGPENILALSDWFQAQREVLCQHLALPSSIPSQATLYRFFWKLDVHITDLQTALFAWVKACHPVVDTERLVLLAGDGKVLKGSARQGEAALSFLSVFFHELALTVAQTPQNGRHEARVMDGLLDTLHHLFGTGWLLTLDASYTEQGLTGRIINAGGAYLVPLKNNTKTLKSWAQVAFAYPPTTTFCDVEHRCGEDWTRTTCTQTDIPEEVSYTFPAAQTLIRRVHHVCHRDGRVTQEVRYAVCSMLLTAHEAEDIWRQHWGIENRSHHRRDTIFHEDRCRTRLGAQGLALLHGTFLALLHAQTRRLTAFVRRLRFDPLAILTLLGVEPS